MTGQDALRTLEDGDALDFGSISERCIYLYLRFHADRKGVVRLAMSELAAILKVNRQTVLKHVEALVQRQLLRRIGHGRYRVFAEPWSVESVARQYVGSLEPGAEFDVQRLAVLAYGEENDLDWEGDDPRIRELDTMEYRLKHDGLLTIDDDGTARKARPTGRR